MGAAVEFWSIDASSCPWTCQIGVFMRCGWGACVRARAHLVCGRQSRWLAQPRAASSLALYLGTWTALCLRLSAILVACSPSPGESPTPRG